ncbi:MAG: hypothetical protein IJ121_06030 [Eubacterium sp.]|nr:hypothetical protein [Eubacterium sp.]
MLKRITKCKKYRAAALTLGVVLAVEAVSFGGTAAFAETQTEIEVVLEDSGGDLMPAEAESAGQVTAAESGSESAGQVTAAESGFESAGQVTAAESDFESAAQVTASENGSESAEQVMPEQVGESVREIIQAATELAEADEAGIERLQNYIEETKEQYEELPEEGKEILEESMTALDNAAVAVETCQEAARELEETGTITADQNGKENSFRFLNGVPVDESLIAVEEEIQAAAELTAEDLYPETGTAVPESEPSDTNQEADSRDGVMPQGTDQSAPGNPASGQNDYDSRTGSGDNPAGQASDSVYEAQDGSGTDDAERAGNNTGEAGAGTGSENQTEQELITAETDQSGHTGTQNGAEDAQQPAADGTQSSQSGSASPVSAGGISSKELPKADVAVVKTAAGQQLVDLDGSAATQNILTASTEVHKGIDVSHHNGDFDWDLVKKAGIEFVIIRCGHGHNLETGGDACWLRNISEAERVGMPYGIYFYSYATTVAGVRKEAATTVKLLKGHKPTLPVFYDMEDVTQKNLSNKLKNQMAKAYCDDVAAVGYQAGLYSYKYWLEGYMSTFINTTNYPIWVAQYASKTTYTGDYVMWQYSSSGKVNGIPGRVDMNYWYGKLKAAARKTTPQVVVDVLNRSINLKPDTRIAQTTSADLYTQEQISPGKWVIRENATGKQLVGFVYIPSLDKICYFDPATGFKVFGQKQINGKYYLFDESGGAMQVGFQYLAAQNKIVYYNALGQMQYGKQYIGGHWHYFASGSGAMKRSAFQKISAKKKCYYDDYGRAVSGEKKIGKYYYYFSPKTFAMKTGLVKVAGTKKTCYYNKKGRRQTGLKKIKGKKYYFKPSNGAMIKSKFKKIKGKKYYFNKKGRMVYGRQKIKGKWYTFNSKTGALIG